MIILVHAYTHRGLAHWQRVSTTFLTRKSSKHFLMLLTGFEPQSYGSGVWCSTNWATPSPQYTFHRGDRVAHLVKHQTQDPKTGGMNPACVRSTRKNCEFFFSQKRCADSLSVCPTPCVYTHAQEWSHKHVKDPVVHQGIEPRLIRFEFWHSKHSPLMHKLLLYIKGHRGEGGWA